MEEWLIKLSLQQIFLKGEGDGASLDATGAIASTGTLAISNGTEKTVFAGATSLSGERFSKLGSGELILGCGASFSVSAEIGNGTLGFVCDSTLSGTISGAGGIHAMTGTVVLAGTATYAGGTSIDANGAVATSSGGFSPSGFSGSGVAEFRTLMPNEASIAVLTDATKWQGVCWLPNMHVVRVSDGKGNTKRMCLCAKCIKSGKVAKA